MPAWTLVGTHPTQGRTFQRPLGKLEWCFFLLGLSHGHTDILRYNEIRLSNGLQDADLFSKDNIARAWLSTKRRHPLAGAVVQWKPQSPRADSKDDQDEGGQDGSTSPHFLVCESNLSVLRPGEIVFFGEVANAAEAEERAAAIVHGPRPLSNDLLVQVGIFREAGSEGCRADVLYVTMLMSHCVADGASSRAIVRCFLDTLARGSSQPEPDQVPLEDRLAMVVPVEELFPEYLRALSPARRRWRMAIAATIVLKRYSRCIGGHGLPRKVTYSQDPARSVLVETLLTPEQSAAVIVNCRKHKVMFGNAYLPLAQVAMTRVLYRMYLRGEISEEEWTSRKKQPHINQGLVNLRSYLDKAWFNSGGGGELLLSMHACKYELPFMTLCGTDREDDIVPNDAPPFSDLLTFDRFLHRAGLVKKQAVAFFSHPLFYEFHDVSYGLLAKYIAAISNVGAGNGNVDIMKGVGTSPVQVMAHSGSSLGNMDVIFPFDYPLPSTHPLSPYSPVSHPSKAGYTTPFPCAPTVPEVDTVSTIMVECAKTLNHSLQGDIHLGAETWRGRLRLYAFFDGNMYDEAMVREWVDEVKAAVLCYLG